MFSFHSGLQLNNVINMPSAKKKAKDKKSLTFAEVF